ncbi:hypothetical protein BABINDRAFT_163194 [Babjeviella inositovora NRRL Y-12698]|uniref:Mitochondrial thiamine pyrophosphate carrier 1 n=1 Tax=Babjeviella inositovora NRRL Y-12698 TaxID=984486 RepID=A0A1E3QLE1_9ASCO|nr:uncharacterized protein BABINDRAFT_163194 [Babjeviella inositovora NRRL Y-12698]ODQ77807.1 hypothetical protein BABINDRAFT_163194 [Babjeviella inositovora NRRL Y-12698]
MVTAPLDVVKIRLQLQVSNTKYHGIIGTMSTVVREEGVRALWKGNVPAEILYVVYGGVQFTTYSFVNSQLASWGKENPHWAVPSAHSFISGFVAGSASTMVTYPFDLLRTRLAANTNKQFQSFYGTIKDVYLHESGIRGFYAGIAPTMISVCLNTGVMFQTYNWARWASSAVDMPFAEPICGFIAGAFSKGVTFPLDLLRRRLQMVGSSKPAVDVICKIFAVEGTRGFYKGFLVSVLKTAPTSALTMWVYEYLLRLLLHRKGLE